MAADVGRQRGIEIVEIVPGSPAARAGIKSEDLVVEVDGVPVEGMDDLQRLMDGSAVSRTMPIRVYRDGRTLTLDVTPIELSA